LLNVIHIKIDLNELLLDDVLLFSDSNPTVFTFALPLCFAALYLIFSHAMSYVYDVFDAVPFTHLCCMTIVSIGFTWNDSI